MQLARVSSLDTDLTRRSRTKPSITFASVHVNAIGLRSLSIDVGGNTLGHGLTIIILFLILLLLVIIKLLRECQPINYLV